MQMEFARMEKKYFILRAPLVFSPSGFPGAARARFACMHVFPSRDPFGLKHACVSTARRSFWTETCMTSRSNVRHPRLFASTNDASTHAQAFPRMHVEGVVPGVACGAATSVPTC